MAWQLVREVSDPGMAGTYACCNFQGAFEAEVRDVTATTDTVDDEVVKVLKFGEFLICNMVHVSAVGNITESIAKYR